MTAERTSRTVLASRSPATSVLIGGAGMRASTIVIAPSDASDASKRAADIVLTGNATTDTATLNSLTASTLPSGFDTPEGFNQFGILFLEGMVVTTSAGWDVAAGWRDIAGLGEATILDGIVRLHGPNTWDSCPTFHDFQVDPIGYFPPVITAYDWNLHHLDVEGSCAITLQGQCFVHDILVDGFLNLLIYEGESSVSDLIIEGTFTVLISPNPGRVYIPSWDHTVSHFIADGDLNVQINSATTPGPEQRVIISHGVVAGNATLSAI